MAADYIAETGSWPRRVLAVVAAGISLTLTAVFAIEAVNERTVVVASPHALVLGDAAETLPAGADGAARRALRLDPLNQNALNIAYVAAVRRHDAPSRLARFQTLLSQLGWRSTSAQQNLLVAAATREDFPAILDRVDGLLRRNKLVTQLDPFIAAVEKDPRTRLALVAKLRRSPPWRELFLVRGGELHGSDRLTARAATMTAVLVSGVKLTRVEVAPFLVAAAAGGELDAAYRLWERTLRVPTTGGLLYDGSFKIAAEQGVRPPLPVPFEWRFENGDGYTTQVGSDGGLFVRWDGHGVPVLVSQPVRIPAGARGYQLHVEADHPSLPVVADQLTLTLSCAKQTVQFRQVARRSTSLDLVAGPLTCSMPLFTIAGRLQDVAQPTSATMTSLTLAAR